MKWIRPFIFSVIIVAAILGGYHNTLNSPFLFDDLNNIVNNPYIKIDRLDAASFSKVFSENRPTKTRPVASLSFALNYLVGGENPVGFHIVNILIHILLSLAVFRLFYLYLRYETHSENATITLAFATCILWALNPVQTNAVTYIVQRMTSLCALFIVASILMYFQARCLSVGDKVKRNRSRIIVYSLASLLFWFAALMTKEIAAIVPVLILLHEFFFFDGLSTAKIKEHKLLYLFMLVCPLMIIFVYLGPMILGSLFAGYEIRDFTLSERLLTEPRVVLRYMSLFLFPLPSRLTLYYDYPVSQALFTPPSTFLSIIALSSLLAGAVYYAKRFRLVAFGILWTLTCLVIESSFIPLEIIFEHRFYMPSIGFSLSIVYAVYCSLKYFRSTVFAPLLLVTVASVFVALTYTRNETWKSEIEFSLDGVKKAPASVRSNTGLAFAYLKSGDVVRGAAFLEKAYELDREHVVVLANLFVLSHRLNSTDRESYYLSELKRSILSGNFVCNQANALDPVARILFRQQRFADAALVLEALVQCRVPAVVHQNLAVCYQQTGNNAKAIEHFESALRLKPGYPYYLYRLSYLYYQEGDRENGLEMYHQLKETALTQKSENYIQELESLFIR